MVYMITVGLKGTDWPTGYRM